MAEKTGKYNLYKYATKKAFFKKCLFKKILKIFRKIKKKKERILKLKILEISMRI